MCVVTLAQGPAVAETGVLRTHIRSLAALTADLVRKLFVVMPSDRERETVRGYVNIESVASALPFEAAK